MNGRKRILVFILLIISMVMMSSCRSSDNNNGSSLGGEIASSTGVFGFAGGFDDNHYFIQEADSTLGKELSSGYWDHDWTLSNNSFILDGKQYIFGMRDPSWFIQEVLPSGKLGKETDSGSNDLNYNEAVALTVSDGDTKKVFIFMIESAEQRWAIWEVKAGGKLADERSDHGYADKNAEKVAGDGVLTALTLDTKACFYGQYNGAVAYWFDHAHTWAIQCVTADGKLEDKSRDHGEWNSFWGVTTSYRTNGKTYIVGHREKTHWDGIRHSTGPWFIQRIYDDGTMGHEIDHGEWSYFYGTMTSYKNDRSYIMGQSDDDDNHWFIQHVTGKGKMGAVTDDGHWDNLYAQLISIELD